jgi:hypothetical protein
MMSGRWSSVQQARPGQMAGPRADRHRHVGSFLNFLKPPKERW